MSQDVFHKTISKDDPQVLCDALHLISGLSKVKLKDAMTKGAVWTRRAGGKKRRVRRAKASVRTGDAIWLYYDSNILEKPVPKARCELDRIDYSIWFKPAGLMSQGSPFGDHCALPRQIESHFNPARRVHLVHRLDREVPGLILVAHTKHAAASLSEMLRENRIEKQYHARVRGDLGSSDAGGKITIPLDGRPAVTNIKVTGYDKHNDITETLVMIETGRLHQIRRHFHLIGHPVMGDPRYGRNNSDSAGLQLTACSIAFDCPFGGGRIDLAIPPCVRPLPMMK